MEDTSTTDWIDTPFKGVEELMGQKMTLVGFREFRDKTYDIDKVIYYIELEDGGKAKFSSAGKYLKNAALYYKDKLPLATMLIRGTKVTKGKKPPLFFRGLYVPKPGATPTPQ